MFPVLSISIFTGGGGFDFNDGQGKKTSAILKSLCAYGTTSILPTVTTSARSDLIATVDSLADAHKKRKKPVNILGINLEGPYLSIGKRGAQPLRFLRNPSLGDVEEVLDAARGLVRIMTLAPELDDGFKLIRLLKDRGVIPAIGHTIADYDTTCRAIKAGLIYATHIFNSYPPLHHRRPGPVGALLESNRVYLEVLSDGIHLSPVIIRLLFRLKLLDKLLLVTDGIAVMGRRLKTFSMGGREVTVSTRGARLADGTLVGSLVRMNRALRNIRRFTDLTFSSALVLATRNPALLLGVENRKGDLVEGMDADIVITDSKFSIKRTIVGGVTVYRKK